MFERLTVVVLVIIALGVGIAFVILLGIVVAIYTVFFVIAELISWVLNGFIWLWNKTFNKNAAYISRNWFLF